MFTRTSAERGSRWRSSRWAALCLISSSLLYWRVSKSESPPCLTNSSATLKKRKFWWCRVKLNYPLSLTVFNWRTFVSLTTSINKTSIPRVTISRLAIFSVAQRAGSNPSWASCTQDSFSLWAIFARTLRTWVQYNNVWGWTTNWPQGLAEAYTHHGVDALSEWQKLNQARNQVESHNSWAKGTAASCGEEMEHPDQTENMNTSVFDPSHLWGKKRLYYGSEMIKIIYHWGALCALNCTAHVFKSM